MADQHNADIPALGNTIAADVVDIKENLEFHKDCFEALCTGWSNSSTAGLQVVESFPATTVMLFGQNSAPTGWTRKADWQDNAMLCYASAGNIGSGGSVNPQTAHNHQWHNYIASGTTPQTYNSSGNAINITTGDLAAALYFSISAGTSAFNLDGYTTKNTAPHYQEVIAATKD